MWRVGQGVGVEGGIPVRELQTKKKKCGKTSKFMVTFPTSYATDDLFRLIKLLLIR